MAAPKVFYNDLALLPIDLSVAVGHYEQRRINGNLLVIAHLKREIPDLLTARGVERGHAYGITPDLGLQRSPHYPRGIRILIDAGIIDPATVGAYAWLAGQKDRPVVRLELDGGRTVIGHFRNDPARGGRGLYAEPVMQEQQA